MVFGIIITSANNDDFKKGMQKKQHLYLKKITFDGYGRIHSNTPDINLEHLDIHIDISHATQCDI